MIYCFDIDGTICSTNAEHDYTIAEPFPDVVDEINKLHAEGHTIRLATARGYSSGIDWREFTHEQMEKWGIKYHQLCVGKKLGADIYIDDKAMHIDDFRRKLNKKIGILAGSFDLIHAGYIYMFQDAKRVCDHLIVALQEDSSVERPYKTSPVQSLEDRKLILESIKYIDEIQTYDREQDLYDLLKNSGAHLRILGSDYRGQKFTGENLGMEVYFHGRNHDRSTTALKEKIKKSL
tara:strand:+ start:1133 stop:1837 length:705 start_codon:yes stop_codon:yes gene_type:complete